MEEDMANLREELEKIRTDYDGLLTAEAVVQAATPEEHPLHSHFEWDNAVAGHLYRQEQARSMLRTVKMTYTNPQGEEVRIRAYQAVRSFERQMVYEPSDVVAADPILRAMVLRDMRREWLSLQRRYGHFEEFIQMVRTDVGA